MSSDNSCIGHLENNLHEVFASARVPGEDYVYSSSTELYNSLDDYCDEQVLLESRPPFLVLGEHGSGKSALLANWCNRRAKSKSRNRNEFIFWHAIGCTRHSTRVSNMLRRLMTELKKQFELTREVSAANDNLSWEFPRFLELAAKKGKVIIVMDGLGRLTTDDGNEASMMWLPLEFPANVRVILTAAAPNTMEFNGNGSSGGDSSPRKSRFITELERRKLQVLRIKPLERPMSRGIIEAFIRKTVQGSSTAHLSTAFLTESEENEESNMGLVMFDTQLARIADHPLATNPLFLSVYLRCINWAVTRGYSMWQLEEEWLAATDCKELMHVVLGKFEEGFSRQNAQVAADCEKAVAAGGLAALRAMYEWHPLFMESAVAAINDNDDSYLAFQEQTGNSDVGKGAGGGGNKTGVSAGDNAPAHLDNKKNAFSNSVQQSLGDQEWLATSEAAEAKLEFIRMHSGRSVTDTIAQANKHSDHGDSKTFMEVLVANMLSMRAESSEIDASDKATMDVIMSSKTVDDDAEEEEEEEEDAQEGEDGLNNMSFGSALTPAGPATQGSGSVSGVSPDHGAKLPSGGESSETKKPLNKATSFNIPDENDSFDSSTLHQASTHLADPHEGFDNIPVYLRGGVENEGFKSLLGHALALLLVARHGLRESELWSMLIVIKDMEASTMKATASVNDEARALISIFYRYRGQLEDVWRTIDTFHNCQLSKKQLLAGMKKVNPEFNMFDLKKILETVGLLSEDGGKATPEGAYIPNRTSGYKIDYKDLLARVESMDRKMKNYDSRVRITAKQLSSVSAVDDFDDFSFDEPKAAGSSNNLLGTDGTGKENSTVTLGPVMEASLLSVLCALGVLHSTEHQILVLPVDSRVLREVVYERYVCNRPGELQWHQRVINYFQRQSNSLRRCEELPWHLQICRKWYHLKDALTDLASFEMMFSGELKEELMQYWLVLTEGPLFVSDEAQKDGISKQLQSDNSNILSELDVAAARGLSEKEARKQLLANQVATFDVVNEFNKSIENWVLAAHPTTVKLCRMLTQIAYFLAEFSMKGEVPPPFLRLPVDKKALDSFGVRSDEIMHAVLPDFNATATATTSSAAATTSPSNGDAQGSAANSAKEKTDMEQLENQMYYYNRWIWMQFPWMALEQAAEMSANASRNLKAEHRKNHRGSKGELGASEVESIDYIDGDVYGIGPGDEDGDGNEATAKDHMNEHTRRFWSVKKHDPSQSMVEFSEHRKSAQVKNALTSVHSANAFQACLKDTIESNHILGLGRNVSKYHKPLEDAMAASQNIPFAEPSTRSLKTNTRFPSIRLNLSEKYKSMEEDENLYSKANNTMRLGGTVELPTVGDLEREIEKILQDEKLSQMNLRRGSAIPFKNQEEVEYADELDRLGRLRVLSDKIHERKKERFTLLESVRRDVEDRVRADQEVASNLTSGEIAIASMEDRYSTLQQALEEGRCHNQSYRKLIEVMHACPPFTERHVAALEQEVELARQQLIDLCNSRRAMYLEAEKLQKKQTDQLHEKIHYYSTNRKTVQKKADTIYTSLPGLRNLNIRSRIQSRETGGTRESTPYLSGMVQDEEESQTNSQEPAEVTDNVRKIGDMLARNVFLASSTMHKPGENGSSADAPALEYFVMDSNANMDSTATHSRLTSADLESRVHTGNGGGHIADGLQHMVHTTHSEAEAKRKLEYLQEKTHSSSPEEFIEKFTSNIQLTESLKTHQNVCDSKIAQLRQEHTDLYESFGSTVQQEVDPGDADTGTGTGTGAGAACSQKELDDKLFKTEMKLNSNSRKAEKSILLINEIRTGVQHLVSLLVSNAKILTNLPKSPLPILASDEDVAPVLSWCEERVLAIQEALILDTSSAHPAVYDNNKLHERQIQLSNLIHQMTVKVNNKSRKKKRFHEKRDGGISQGIISSHAEDNITPRAVMVTSKGNEDNLFEKKMKSSTEGHDKNELVFEDKMRSLLLQKGDPAKDVAKFLNDSLTTHDSKELLRKANFLSNKKQGRHAGYGFALESVLRSKLSEEEMNESVNVAAETEEKNGRPASPTKRAYGMGDSEAVMDRDEFKTRSIRERQKHEKKSAKKADFDSQDDESTQGAKAVKSSTKQLDD